MQLIVDEYTVISHTNLRFLTKKRNIAGRDYISTGTGGDGRGGEGGNFFFKVQYFFFSLVRACQVTAILSVVSFVLPSTPIHLSSSAPTLVHSCSSGIRVLYHGRRRRCRRGAAQHSSQGRLPGTTTAARL